MKLSDGLHQIGREEYDALTSYRNFSTLKAFARSPAHFHETLLNKSKEKDKDAYKIGRCSHWAVYEPEVFGERVVVWDCGKRAGAEWNEFRDRNEDKEILTEKEYEECRNIGIAVRNNPMTAQYVSGGRSEVTVLWLFRAPSLGGLPGYQVPCKSRIDFLKGDCIVDLKTCRDGSPSGFGKACWNYLYHVQAAMYQDAVFTATGKRLPYVIVAAEKTAPYVSQLYRVPDELLQLGRETYRTWMDQLVYCRGQSKWPGYSETEMDLVLPRWAAPEEDTDATGMDLVIAE